MKIFNKKIIILFFLSLSLIYYKKIIVLAMIIGGFFVAPEASQILAHYCFGDGSDLYLNSNYLKKSPVILSQLKKMQKGEQKEVRFSQKEDWRLSYALNPFTLMKGEKNFKIRQYIQFATRGDEYTFLHLGFWKIKVYDRWIKEFKGKPFWVYAEFELPQD